MKSLIVGFSLVVALCIASTALAHHSAAGIDQTKSVNVEGIVKTFKWANPHSWIEMEVKNTKGDTEIWNLEMNPPSYLVRAGWKSTTIKPGDKIKVTARPFRNRDPRGPFFNLILPGGRGVGHNAPKGNGAGTPRYGTKEPPPGNNHTGSSP